jgi:NAD(P)-dependent dehydrogenase (short-subunit alcohol dehydrogenase family)
MTGALVTGATGGLGQAIVDGLLAEGLAVTAVGRDRAALDSLGRRGARALAADLRTADGCAAVTGDVLADREVTVVVHAAGVWPHRRELTEEGWETAFAVNHLAPFRINAGTGEVLSSRSGRIVQVGAGLAVRGSVDLERTPTGQDFGAVRTYVNTKLWNALATYQWASQWPGTPICSIHPGVVRTGLGARPGALGALLRVAKRRWLEPQEGARGPVTLAVAEVPLTDAFVDQDAISQVPMPHRDQQQAVFARTRELLAT